MLVLLGPLRSTHGRYLEILRSSKLGGGVTAAIPAPLARTSGTSVVQKLGSLNLGRSLVSCFSDSPGGFAALHLCRTRRRGGGRHPPLPWSRTGSPKLQQTARSQKLVPFPIPNVSSFLVGWVAEPRLPLRAKPV